METITLPSPICVRRVFINFDKLGPLVSSKRLAPAFHLLLARLLEPNPPKPVRKVCRGKHYLIPSNHDKLFAISGFTA